MYDSTGVTSPLMTLEMKSKPFELGILIIRQNMEMKKNINC